MVNNEREKLYWALGEKVGRALSEHDKAIVDAWLKVLAERLDMSIARLHTDKDLTEIIEGNNEDRVDKRHHSQHL